MVEPEPEIRVPVQTSYTNNTMFFSVFWTKLFWSRSQKSQHVGAGAKKIRFPEQTWTTRIFRLELKLELTQLSEIRLELKLAEFRRIEIKTKIRIRNTFTQIKATSIQVQFMSKCEFILISMRKQRFVR